MLKITKAKVRPLIPSVITAEMNISGGITGEGALEVAGKVDGNIRCISILINESGVIEGDITAEKIEVFGRVQGNLIGKNVICGQTAKVYGNITHQSLHIEEGAFIEGVCSKHSSAAEGKNSIIELTEISKKKK